MFDDDWQEIFLAVDELYLESLDSSQEWDLIYMSQIEKIRDDLVDGTYEPIEA